jgi:putative sigma-54 modulation protein
MPEDPPEMTHTRYGLNNSLTEDTVADRAAAPHFPQTQTKEREDMKDRQNDVIISGNHLDLTDAIKQNVADKMSKLFQHEERIIRIRVELEVDTTTPEKQQVAQGQIEIKGPDLVATVRSDDLYKSIDALVNKLDRMLRRRSRMSRVKRKRIRAVELPSRLPKVATG